MSTYKLTKQTCLNPYFIECGLQVERIHFFKGGEIIASTNRGWLPMYGSNSSGNTAIESIEYRRKRKQDLNGNYSFFIGPELFVNIAELNNFLFAPDVKQMESDTTTYYGDMAYFDCGSTDGRHEHLERVELRGFMMGYYSKCIPTVRGKKILDIVSVFNDAGVDMASYDAAKILDNKTAILSAIED